MTCICHYIFNVYGFLQICFRANESPLAAIFAIGNDAKPVPTLSEKFSSEARLFVSACLTRDQKKRPSAAELLSHQFLLKRMKKPASFS